MGQNNDTPDLQSVLDKWLAFAREEAKRQAAGQTNTPPVCATCTTCTTCATRAADRAKACACARA